MWYYCFLKALSLEPVSFGLMRRLKFKKGVQNLLRVSPWYSLKENCSGQSFLKRRWDTAQCRTCVPFRSSHAPQGCTLGALLRLSQVNCVPFPFLPFDCPPQVASSRVSYNIWGFLLPPLYSWAEHWAWHREAAHCLPVTCLVGWRCVLTDHVCRGPRWAVGHGSVNRGWMQLPGCRLQNRASGGFQSPPAIGWEVPSCKSSLPHHTQMLCEKVKDLCFHRWGEEFADVPCDWGVSREAQVFSYAFDEFSLFWGAFQEQLPVIVVEI